MLVLRCSAREVLRFVSRLPLDVAAEARPLDRRRRPPRERRVERPAQVLSGHRYAVSGPGAVHLATVDEPTLAVEDEEVRRAGGAVRLGDLLRLVEEVREGVARLLRLAGH